MTGIEGSWIEPDEVCPLSAAQRRAVGVLVWQALRRYRDGLSEVTSRWPPAALAESPVVLQEEEFLKARLGLFVTLRLRGKLRGCLGSTEATEPLWRAAPRLARAAATSDPRFGALPPQDVAFVEVEVSLLGESVRQTAAADEIIERLQPGVHGVWLSCDGRRGLLLPQVAVQFGWSAREFLEGVAAKSGLAAASWCASGAELRTFRVSSFRAEPPE